MHFHGAHYIRRRYPGRVIPRARSPILVNASWDPNPLSGALHSPWPSAAASRPYSFLLLGSFQSRRVFGDWGRLEARKLQEIMSYLLLYRQRAHQREVLAGTLWGSADGPRSRKNLRQGLWQLQEKGDTKVDAGDTPLLLVKKNWVQVNEAGIWLDVAEMERVFAEVGTSAGENLSDLQAANLMRSVDLYRGDLLEGWREEWCVFERERLRAMQLAMLEKLIGYCEASGRYQEGLVFGERLLRHDAAHERAHWRMMRLSYLAGDRTGALRQFEKCRVALQDELGVAPDRQTTLLYRQICADIDGILTPARSAARP